MNNSTSLRERLDKLGEEITGKAKIKESVTKGAVYNSAFWANMQRAEISDSLKEGSDGSGGYLVPDTFEEKVLHGLEEKNTIRRISKVFKTNRRLKIPVISDKGSAAWCTENEETIETDFETSEIEFDAYKLANMILLTDELIQDSPTDVEDLIYQFFTISVSRKEQEAFIHGDGKSKPLGLIHQADIGAITEKANEITFDDLINLEHSVPKVYRKNACWVMSNETFKTLMKIKNHKGRLIWGDSHGKSVVDRLIGYPICVCDELDGIESGSIPVLFGNFDYFWIAERGNRTIKRLSERYAEYGKVGYITTERLDAQLVDKNAIKSLKVK